MTASAIIAGSLVDMKNVSCHKCLRLVIDVPAEQALEVIKALGWATAVNPIPVAVARLEQPKEVMPNSGQPAAVSEHKTPPVPPADKATGRVPKTWDDLKPSQQAGILCSDPSFKKFMEIEFGMFPPGGCAEKVRLECHVGSRKEILPGTRAADLWKEIVADFRAWQREAEVVPA